MTFPYCIRTFSVTFLSFFVSSADFDKYGRSQELDNNNKGSSQTTSTSLNQSDKILEGYIENIIATWNKAVPGSFIETTKCEGPIEALDKAELCQGIVDFKNLGELNTVTQIQECLINSEKNVQFFLFKFF